MEPSREEFLTWLKEDKKCEEILSQLGTEVFSPCMIMLERAFIAGYIKGDSAGYDEAYRNQ